MTERLEQYEEQINVLEEETTTELTQEFFLDGLGQYIRGFIKRAIKEKNIDHDIASLFIKEDEANNKGAVWQGVFEFNGIEDKKGTYPRDVQVDGGSYRGRYFISVHRRCESAGKEI
ncbi:MAG TPA: hypothetical protein VNK81_04875 [Thermodesulfobacteriota bacterium]|jgi:hypothetical protein|nr:hypothetical protein [Thermodesulfobacteriota bacterium]